MIHNSADKIDMYTAAALGLKREDMIAMAMEGCQASDLVQFFREYIDTNADGPVKNRRFGEMVTILQKCLTERGFDSTRVRRQILRADDGLRSDIDNETVNYSEALNLIQAITGAMLENWCGAEYDYSDRFNSDIQFIRVQCEVLRNTIQCTALSYRGNREALELGVKQLFEQLG